MDTSDYPSLPSLSHLHAQLASNSRCVEMIIDSQTDGIERLFSATIAQDWQALAEASRYLAGLRAEHVGTEVIREARNVYEELVHQTGEKKQPQHLARLLTACRTIRKKQEHGTR